MTPKMRALAMILAGFGDDLERSKAAFKGLAARVMDSEYGQSGKTRYQIIADYEKRREEDIAAYDWAARQPE